MSAWKVLVFTLLIVGCAGEPERTLQSVLNSCASREKVLQDLRELGYPAGSFCAATSTVENDPFTIDKDAYLDEQRWLNSDSVAVELAQAHCAKEVPSYFPDGNRKRTLAMCEFFNIESYRRLNRALMEQVDVACEALADHYCTGIPVDTRAVTRACIERNEPARLKALMHNELTIPSIQ